MRWCGTMQAKASPTKYEADAYASAVLTKSGIGTEGQKSLFLKLEALTKNQMGAAPAWLLSHPKTDERIAAIEANEAKWNALTS